MSGVNDPLINKVPPDAYPEPHGIGWITFGTKIIGSPQC